MQCSPDLKARCIKLPLIYLDNDSTLNYVIENFQTLTQGFICAKEICNVDMKKRTIKVKLEEILDIIVKKL